MGCGVRSSKVEAWGGVQVWGVGSHRIHGRDERAEEHAARKSDSQPASQSAIESATESAIQPVRQTVRQSDSSR